MSRATEQVLASILERLERMEETNGSPAVHNYTSARVLTSRASSPASMTPVQRLSAAPTGVYDTGSTPFMQLGDDQSHEPASLDPSDSLSPPAFDADSVLRAGLDHMQRLRNQELSVKTVAADINIPPDLARSWIRSK